MVFGLGFFPALSLPPPQPLPNFFHFSILLFRVFSSRPKPLKVINAPLLSHPSLSPLGRNFLSVGWAPSNFRRVPRWRPPNTQRKCNPPFYTIRLRRKATTWFHLRRIQFTFTCLFVFDSFFKISRPFAKKNINHPFSIKHKILTGVLSLFRITNR